MKLTPIVLDFESWWSQDHTLSKMNPIDYVMHPDTEIQSCSITLPGKETRVIFGEDSLREAFSRLPWDRLYAIGHNMSGFDAMILAWRFGVEPAMWGCTLAMSRALYAKETALSLDAMLKFLGAPFEKGSLEATNTKGLRLADFTPQMRAAMKEYNKVDGDGCMWLFKKLAPQIGARELRVIDMTIRMLVDKKLQIDAPLLEETLVKVKEEKRLALLNVADLLDVDWEDEAMRIEEVRAKLASAPKFSLILEHYGFDVPMKASKTAAAKGQHKLIPALSKTDEAMQELCESDHPIIGPCAQARLGVKSTQLETRIQTFLKWHERTGGGAPMPLHYCGADTTGRWSGCLVADTLVIVMEPDDTVWEKRIVDVLPDDLVWDGEEFVPHEGVVFSGYQEVITHDGVTGTEDHVVFTNAGEIGLREAMQGGHAIETARRPEGDILDPYRSDASEHEV